MSNGITTGSLSLSDDTQISASTFGTGDAGSVLVQAKDSVSAAGNSTIFSNVQSGAVGNGGNINITAPTLSLTDGSELSTSVRGASNNLPAGFGIAGNVFVDVSGDVTISGVKDYRSGIFSTLGTGAKGKGGNINLTASSLSLSDGATLATSTYGTGDAGSVLVQAKNSVSAASNSAIFSRVENGAVGNGGNINITAPTLSLTDDGQLSTSVRGASQSLPAGFGIAGDVNVNVSGDVTISGVKNGFPSGIFSTLGTGAKGKGGNINITASSLSLSDGAQLDATTFGIGDAGSVIIDARRVFLDGKNTIVFSIVETTGRGKGGDIGITTDSLSLTNGAVLTASTLGEGDPGNVLVQAKDSISVAGNSYILSDLRGGAKGKGGNINLKTGSLFLTDDAQISASTSGAGDAGTVLVQAKDSVSVANNSGIFSIVESGAVGNGGNINITAPTLSLTDGSQVSTFVRGASKNLPAGFGIAGNVFVDVSGDVTISGVKDYRSGIFSYLGGGAKGKGGNINLTAGSLFLTDGAQISASTFGIGDANSVLVQAKDSVSVARNSGIFSIVESGAVGNGGDVNITAPTLSLTDGSQLSTFVSGASKNLPAGFGIAGNVIVDVSGNITISGVNSLSGISSYLGTGAKGKGGNINITASSLSVTDGATLIASTGGEGDAGNIQINATDSVTFSGTSSSSGFSSALFTNTSPNSKGKGGDIAVNTNVLRVSDGAVLNAGTRNNSNGGNITVNARQVEAINGGQFLTSTNGSGNAGKITLNATEQVNVNGSDPTFNDRVAKFGTRVANSEAVSGFFVRSQGSGIAGDIEVTSPQIRLDNGGKLNAESASGNGGNINIINSDLLLLRRNSSISATAGLAQGFGNGGNITINAKTIAAVPKENSDITADAFEGSGGNVTITTDGLFGIAPADDLTSFSDITASSKLGVQGQIDITQPDVQPTQGLVELPGQILDASDQIASVCPNGNTASRPLGEFVVSGRGSLPPNPLELMPGTTSLSPLATLDGQSSANLPKTSPTPAIPPTPTAIVEAQGWVKTAQGKIALVASAPSTTPSASTTGATCPVSK
jgi:large exoprotein involved in heme utilization and adhesion